MTGFVSFVSSGPGDPELMTLKAVRRLSEADVILFDDLSAGPAMAHTRDDAELIAVGKRAGKRSFRQDHVNQLLLDHAQTGARIVRLKSGDAGLFGRLEEEIIALRSENIEFEIIPGVPSAFAAAAEAGIPLTRRLSARRVQFVTGADVTGDLPERLNWAALADPQATTVVFMGKRTFPKLAAGLIAHGLSPDTPTLYAEAVGQPGQKLSRQSLTALAELMQVQTSTEPALILIGPLMDGAE